MELFAPHAQIALLAQSGTDVSSWQVSTKRGTQSGVGASVSGAGGYAHVEGAMSFQLQHLDKSTTYDEVRTKYQMSGGVSGFWAWLLGLKADASQEHEEVHQVFNEVANSQAVQGAVNIKLDCTGLYPNVQVDASAFVLVLQITNSQGSTFNMISDGNPPADTGAQDQNGAALPTKNNQSTITI